MCFVNELTLLQEYRDPAPGSDLNEGFEKFVDGRGDNHVTEGLQTET